MFEWSTVATTETVIRVAATNVDVFLGSNEGTPEEAGVRITDGELGLVIYKTVETGAASPEATFALTASGGAEILGVPNLTLSGVLAARVNTTGVAVDETLTTPGGTVNVLFTDEQGDFQAFAGSDIEIVVADFVEIMGDFAFERTVNGDDTKILIGAANVRVLMASQTVQWVSW